MAAEAMAAAAAAIVAAGSDALARTTRWPSRYLPRQNLAAGRAIGHGGRRWRHVERAGPADRQSCQAEQPQQRARRDEATKRFGPHRHGTSEKAAMLGLGASLSTRVASLRCRTTRHTASLASGRHCPSWVHSPPVSVRLALANAAELADAVVNKNLVAQWITSWACPAVACARTATAQRCPQAQPVSRTFLRSHAEDRRRHGRRVFRKGLAYHSRDRRSRLAGTHRAGTRPPTNLGGHHWPPSPVRYITSRPLLPSP